MDKFDLLPLNISTWWKNGDRKYSCYSFYNTLSHWLPPAEVQYFTGVRPGVIGVQPQLSGCTGLTMKSVQVHPSQPEMQNLVGVEIPALKSDWPRWNPCTFPARSVAQATSFPGALAHMSLFLAYWRKQILRCWRRLSISPGVRRAGIIEIGGRVPNPCICIGIFYNNIETIYWET